MIEEIDLNSKVNTIIPWYLQEIGSRTPHRYYNLYMFKSLTGNTVFAYNLHASSLSRLLLVHNTM
jgi:hypothetical protein